VGIHKVNKGIYGVNMGIDEVNMGIHGSIAILLDVILKMTA